MSQFPYFKNFGLTTPKIWPPHEKNQEKYKKMCNQELSMS